MVGRPTPLDYDEDPDRFLGGTRIFERYWSVSDVHEDVAERLSQGRAEPVLDIGCGNGRLMSHLNERGMAFVGLDSSSRMLASVHGPRVLGDAAQLPFRSGSLGSVAALYMLYHLPDPRLAIAESYRVLRPGGLFVASTPSRHDDPELRSALPRTRTMTFDAESGPELVAEVFRNVKVERWDAPLVHLPDHDAVALYLYHHNQIPKAQAQRIALDIPTPMTLTKRGALIWAYKRP